MAGYSGTPLPKKLGIVEGSTLALLAEPSGVVVGLPPGVTVKRQARGKADVVVAFSPSGETSNVALTRWGA
jgi:D-arabinose 5-phosphate isomerase GutQ